MSRKHTGMSEVRDSAIKLFGRTISLPLSREVNGSSVPAPDDCSNRSLPSSSFSPCEEDGSAGEIEAEADENKEPSSQELTSLQEDVASVSHQTNEGSKSPTTTSSGNFENPKTPSAERESSLQKSCKNGEQSDTSNSQEKSPKKPDKILPCPRCNSMDTKFCYYNNYNVNQPRHFCKNCQRYWTAGGTMRNVPVGAGRRKNKNSSASHYRHIIVPEALQTAQANAANGLHSAVLGHGAAVLTFGSDSPLCDSMASALNLTDKTQNGVLNGFHVPEQNIFLSCGRKDNGDAHSIGASGTASTSSEKRGNTGSQESVDKSYQTFPPQMPCFPAGSPWPYPWNSTQWSSPIAPPSIFPPSYPVSFYPTPAYWGCAVPASWNIPCISTQSSVNNSASNPGPNSPTLGKHSRDGNTLSPVNSQKEEPDKDSTNSETGVLIPKTLRIDDPSEAAKSSIWSTLGIKNEKFNSTTEGGLFKAFPSKGNDKNHVVEASPVLQANPAALSRSLMFHERT